MNYASRAIELYPDAVLQKKVELSRYTTLRVGGPADYFAEPESEMAVRAFLRAAQETHTPVLVLGNGSNLLVRDGGFPGVALHLGRGFGRIEAIPGGLRAQAGALMSSLSRAALEANLAGLEFAQGIPGTVGGGAYMNAGAYGGELGALIVSLRVLRGGRVEEIPASEMAFSYRHTRAMEEGWLILSADFSLQPGEQMAIEEKMRDYAARRREKQPLEYPSAGSFFKRPAGYFAGALIEQAGLKGLAVGGAQVSEKHAGFLINRGGATAADFLALMERVQTAVQQKFGVRLENEVRIVGRSV